MKLGYQLEKEDRMLSKEEAYVQLGHSASLLKAILDSVRGDRFQNRKLFQ
jgi:hypothetical protein